MKCIDTRGRYTDGGYDAEANSGHQADDVANRSGKYDCAHERYNVCCFS